MTTSSLERRLHETNGTIRGTLLEGGMRYVLLFNRPRLNEQLTLKVQEVIARVDLIKCLWVGL